jgi:hypothetical protein
MVTLLLSPRETQESVAVGAAALRRGWDVIRASGWDAPDDLSSAARVFVYGEPAFGAALVRQLGIRLLDVPADWLPRLPERYRRRQIDVTTLAAARAEPRPVFLKVPDVAHIPSQVYASGDELPDAASLDEAMPLLRAEPVAWEVEYRCFVLKGKVQAWSPYAREGSWYRWQPGPWPAPPEEVRDALDFTHRFLADPAVDCPPAVVVDVGKIAGRGWAVVEANAAWCSALYGCNASHALPVIRLACRPTSEWTADDKPWVMAPSFS